LGTARRRVSLARHARLVDYHVHQGNQASTWLALTLEPGAPPIDLAPDDRDPDDPCARGVVPELVVGTAPPADAEAVVFTSRIAELQVLHPHLDGIGLYTWDETRPTLAAGSTSADLQLTSNSHAAALEVRNLIAAGLVPRLLVEETLNPATGREAGRDPTNRHLLTMVSDDPARAPEALQDPVGGAWFVRVHWREPLPRPLCFTVFCPDGIVTSISRFSGNLVRVYHGASVSALFADRGHEPPNQSSVPIERVRRWNHERAALCRLPAGPLAYLPTAVGGEEEPRSTLCLTVETPGGEREQWTERISLIHSLGGSADFVVETDERGRSLVRFGNGENGRQLPTPAWVRVHYQIGQGLDGNVGRDRLTVVHNSAVVPWNRVTGCRNPFDVTSGRDPEPAEQVIRRAPEAYRARQLRAITLADYVERAEDEPGGRVSRAAARYAWTGSWRAVRLAIDPVGGGDLAPVVRQDLARHLDVVRLILDDLELRAPIRVPLAIEVVLCIHPDFWPEDVRDLLEQAFSTGYAPDGRPAFFHPDRWTFGQPLRASQILGQIQAIPGVDHVVSLSLRRWAEATAGTADLIEVRANEIVQVENDPDHLERGRIDFDLLGGRQ
jgi:hypothetical protein